MSSPPSTIEVEKGICKEIPLPDDSLHIHSVTPAQTPLSGWRKIAIVSVFCSAQFFDIFNACASISALPSIGVDLDFTPGVLQWVLAAYTLTFGAFQVPAGRLSDIYHPKPVFCAGYLAVGVFSILCGVSVHPIMLLVFRACSGVGAAMTIPSAIAMIVQNFPDPSEQSRVLGIYGSFGAIGNAIGFVLGGVLAAKASWRWVFFLIGIVTIPFSVLALFFVPKPVARTEVDKRKLDLLGISILTGGLILFVYAVSDGSAQGWSTPQIIITLILSVLLFAAFFVVERISRDPALPPSTWSNKNFAPMFFYTWSAAYSGIVGGFTSWLTGAYGHLIPRRVLLVAGQLFMMIGVILYALASTPDRYWSYIFPGMIISMIGLAMAYVGASVTMMSGARKGEEGVVGAVLYTTFQVGATVGVAVVAAITLGVNQNQSLDTLSQFKGYAASFWSLVGLHGIMIS